MQEGDDFLTSRFKAGRELEGDNSKSEVDLVSRILMIVQLHQSQTSHGLRAWGFAHESIYVNLHQFFPTRKVWKQAESVGRLLPSGHCKYNVVHDFFSHNQVEEDTSPQNFHLSKAVHSRS